MRRLLWAGVVLFFVLFSLIPTFYELSRKNDLHADRQFELVHNYYTDYNFYLSRIREGREGAWTVTEKYTSEPHVGSYIQIMYLYMGKVGALVGVPVDRTDAIYQVGRIVIAVTLLFLISYAAKWAFEKSKLGWQLTAVLLAVTSGSWPILVFRQGEWRFSGYMPWWSIMDSLQRITFIPHMLAGQALILFLLVAMAQRNVMKKSWNWIFLGFLAILLGIVFPPGLAFVFGVWGVFVLFDLFYRILIPVKEWGRWLIDRIAGPAVIGLISAPTLLYFFLALNVYPWKRLIDFAILHPLRFDLREYLLAVGPIFLLGVLGGIWAFAKQERRLLIFVAWVVTWLIGIFAYQHIIQDSPLRFTEMIPQVPLGILGVYLLRNLVNLGNVWRKAMRGIAILLILMGLGQMYSSWRWQKEFIDQKIEASEPLVPTNNYIMYPLKDFIAAMVYLEHSTPRSDVILSETTSGNYIPVISGNTVYVGHDNTVNNEEKELLVHSFFDGSMAADAAQKFLTYNRIHYIYFGPQEVADGNIADLATIYPFLKPEYTNSYVVVYRFVQ